MRRLIVFFCFLPLFVYTQNIEWLKTVGGKQSDDVLMLSTINDTPVIVCNSQSLNIDGHKINSRSVYYKSSLYAAFSQEGKLDTAFFYDDSLINQLSFLELGANHVLIVYEIRDSIRIEGETFYKYHGDLIFVEYKYSKARPILQMSTGARSKIKLIRNNDFLFVAGYSIDSLKLGAVKLNSLKASTFILKFDVNYKLVKHNSIEGFSRVQGIDVNETAVVVAVSINKGFEDTLKYNNQNLNNGQNVGVLFFDLNCEFNSYHSIPNVDNVQSVQLNGAGFYYLTCTYFGQVHLVDSIKIYSKFYKVLDRINQFVFKNNFNGANVWTVHIRPSLRKGLLRTGSAQINEIVLSENKFLYFIGNHQGKISIDPQNFEIGDTTTQTNIMIGKIDSFGNVLWARSMGSPSPIYEIGKFVKRDKDGSIYISGYYFDSLSLGRFNIKSNGSLDVFLAKIKDISISRGEVKKGPYCAGDTIKVPYFVEGLFDTSNSFIAELSDEKGQFNGGGRFLGKVKSSKDSFILGVLPFFNVISSNQYRIRVVSTNPVVQSFYQYDQLRLLIYSKDTANAGGDTTICYGGVTQLSTTGGSKWRWSPGHLVEDSNARITYTKSIVDSTRFRVIISDSSGCGKTDTAYKILRTYKPLKIVNSDTTLCKKGSVLTSNVQGGQPLLYPYVYRWYNEQGKLISKHHSLNTDTMHLSKLQLVVGDNCSGLNDTQWIQINDYPKPQLQFPKDTVVCHAQLYRIKIKAEGGKYPLVSWLASNNDTIQLGHELDSTFLPFNGQGIKLIAHDDCSEQSDTAEMKITVLSPLNANVSLSPDCYKDSVKLSANCSGGKLTSYQTQWFNEAMQFLGSDSSLNYSSKGNQQHVIFQVSDACSPDYKDTITLTPMLSARLQVNKEEQCLKGNFFEFKVLVDTLNSNFNSYKVQIPSNSIIHSGLKYSSTFNDTGHYKVQLKVQSKSNQCVDSTELMVYVRPQPQIHVSWIRSTDSYDSSRWRFSARADVPMSSYSWFIDQFSEQTDDTVWQNFHYEGRVKIHVTGTDVYGCIEDSTYWFDMVHRMRFYIPNAVTDNGDGINDDFYIPGSEYMQEYRLKIFNRWGEKVFDSSNSQEHFKPEFEASSVYIYTLSIFDIYNERHLLKGVFEVLR